MEVVATKLCQPQLIGDAASIFIGLLANVIKESMVSPPGDFGGRPSCNGNQSTTL